MFPAKRATGRRRRTPTPTTLRRISPPCPTSPTSAGGATKKTPPSPRIFRRWSPWSTPAACSVTPVINPITRISEERTMDISRRDLFAAGGKLLILASVGATLEQITGAAPPSETYNMAEHWWGMLVDIDKCIGCGNCVRACSNENQVPKGYFRTWVERYQVGEDQQPHVDSPNGDIDGFPPNTRADVKSFFVPKLCNQCNNCWRRRLPMMGGRCGPASMRRSADCPCTSMKPRARSTPNPAPRCC